MINLLSNVSTEDFKVNKIFEILKTTKDLKKVLIFCKFREVAKTIHKTLSM